MRRIATFLSVAAMVAAPVVFGVAAPASAHSASRFAAATVARPAALPNSDVSGAKATLKYTPAKLKAHWGSATQPPTCNVSVGSFTITNSSAKAVNVTLGGSPFYKIPKGQGLIVCAYGSGRATGVFGLKGSMKTLTVKIS